MRGTLFMGIKKSMAGSPFQVESPSRKYAIEHEAGTNLLIEPKIQCSYKNGHLCTLDQVKFQKCQPFKCAYLHTELRNNDHVCKKCAYYFVKCRKFSNAKESYATFCHFYTDCTSPNFCEINKRVAVNILSRELNKALKTRAHRLKYIRQAEKEKSKVSCSDVNRRYLEEKIIEKQNSVIEIDYHIQSIKEQIGKKR